MKQFSNLETTLIAKWFGHEINIIVEDNQEMKLTELQCLVSETIENKLKEKITVFSEGYISEIIGDSFEKIEYMELVKYYSGREEMTMLEKEDNWIDDSIEKAYRELYKRVSELTKKYGYLTSDEISELSVLAQKVSMDCTQQMKQ